MNNSDSPEDIATRIKSWFSEGKAKMSNRLEKEKNWIAQYLSMNIKTEDRLLWPTASNLDMGGFLTMAHVESFHSKVLNIIQTADPWFSFQGLKSEQADQATRYLSHKLHNDVGINTVIDLWLHNVAISGTRIYTARWEEDKQRVGFRWTFTLPEEPQSQGPPQLPGNDLLQPGTQDIPFFGQGNGGVPPLGQGQSQLPPQGQGQGQEPPPGQEGMQYPPQGEMQSQSQSQNPQLLDSLKTYVQRELGNNTELLGIIPTKEKKDSFLFEVFYLEDYDIKTATLTLKPKGQGFQAEMTFVKKTFEGVRVQEVDPQDFVKAAGPLQTCRYIIHRVWLTEAQVKFRLSSGVYTDITWDEISPGRQYRSSFTQNLKERASGVTPDTSQGYYVFLEAFVLEEGPDGILEDNFYVIYENLGRVVHKSLRTLDGYDYRPYASIILQPIPDADAHTWGIGIPGMIEQLAQEETATHNLVMDSATMAAIPCFFYPQSVPIKPELMKFAPGKGIAIPISDGSLASSIMIPQFSTNLNPMFMLQDRITSIMQAVDGMTDSQPPGKLPKTATQSTQLMNQMNLRFNVLLGRVVGNFADMSGLAGMIKIIASLYRRYGSPIDTIDATGEAVHLEFPDADLDLHLHINADIMNEQLQQSRSQQIMQIALNPGLANIGLITPENIYKAVANHLRTLKVKDITRYITIPKSVSIPQEKENAIMMHGVEAKIHPADDDLQHIQVLKAFEAEMNERYGGIPPQNQPLFDQHEKAHMAAIKLKAQVPQANTTTPGPQAPGSPGTPAPQAVGGQGIPDGPHPKPHGGRHNQKR